MRKRVLSQAMRIALDNNSNHPEWGNFHHFAFLVQNNKIISWGTNRQGPPVQGFGYNQQFGKIHAENDAWRKGKGHPEFLRLEKWEMINIRLNKQGIPRLSRPCDCCFSFLETIGCTSVHFTTGIASAAWAKIKF